MNQNDLNDLLSRPSESLSVEIKTWIDPQSVSGVAKIAKACLALRNRGGGLMLIGFDDKTLTPDRYYFPDSRREVFHLDRIQAIVSRYANDLFEIAVHFGLRDGEEYPVIEVPAGVTVPVVAKRDLKDSNGHILIAFGDIYFRNLSSNGRPSTSKAGPEDWRVILEICFENREADIGRFLRRHLGGTGRQDFFDAVEAMQSPSLRERAHTLLISGRELAREAYAARQESDQPPKGIGTWCVALVFDLEHRGALPSRDFLQKVAAANPQYTGWPVWLDSRSFSNAESRPVVKNGAWEATISSSHGWSQHYDFMRFDPAGRFYLWRALQDDLISDKVAPQTALDPFLVLLRVSEALAVGLQFAKACDMEPDIKLGFAFEWTGLEGRHLESWANPMRAIVPYGTAQVNAVETYTELSGSTSLHALAPHLREATRPLFIVFDGVEFPNNVFEEWAQRLVDRRFS